MIKRTFLDNIRRGLGKTYLELQSATNKEEYKETLLYACFTDCAFDFITDGSKGEYLYNLITLLNDKQYFKQQIISFLENNLPKRGLFAQLTDILACYIVDGDNEIKAFLSGYYTSFTKKSRWSKNKILCYEYLCIIMYQVFGFNKVLSILKDIERLKIDKNELGWFLSIISYKYKNNKTVQSFLPKIEESKQVNISNQTFEEFIELSREDGWHRYFSFRATNIEFEKGLEYLKQTNNKKDILNILRAFQYEDCPKQIPEEVLFSLLNKHDKEVDREIYTTLSFIKSKKVEQLALTLIIDKQNIVSSIHMLMVNYKKEYKELLADVYKKVRFTFYGYNPLIFYTIDFMRTKKLDLPNEILFSAYEKSFDAFSREYIVEIMKKRNLLTKEHINELKYDSNYEIRKKAIKWLKSI